MARASIEDPLKVFRFRVIVDGFKRAGFTEVTGIEKNTEVAKYREGGMNEHVQGSAGLTTFSPVSLKRGQIVGSSRGGDDDFYVWAQQVHDVASAGNAANYRRDLDVEQYSATNVRVRVWRLYDCFPTKFKPASDMKADANENSIEELTLFIESWEKIL